MEKQMTMAELLDELGQAKTNKKEFPEQIERIIPWGEWLQMLKPVLRPEKEKIKKIEHEKSSVRAKVEHVFVIVKGQLRYRKTQYRGPRKQTAKLNMMFALANLIQANRPSRLA